MTTQAPDAPRLVPVEPTEAMLKAGAPALHAGMNSQVDNGAYFPERACRRIYSAMLAAAPAVQPAAGREEIARLPQDDRLSGYPDYLDDPDGLQRFRDGVTSMPDRHRMAPVNGNSLARLLDTIERLRRAAISTPAQASESGGEVADLIKTAKAVTMAAWTDRFGRLHGHETVAALERALAALSAPQAAPSEGEQS